MKIPNISCALGVTIWTVIFFAPVAHGETILIEARPGQKWVAQGRESAGSTPLEVQVHKGDVLNIHVGGGTHGFVTISAKGTSDDANEERKLALVCGEDAAKKPDAVLQEINCGSESKFGNTFVGDMNLKVLDKFSALINFWCVEHTSMMWGTISLKP